MIQKILRGIVCCLVAVIFIRQNDPQIYLMDFNAKMIAFFIGVATFVPGFFALVAGLFGGVIFCIVLELENSLEALLAAKVCFFLFGILARDMIFRIDFVRLCGFFGTGLVLLIFEYFLDVLVNLNVLSYFIGLFVCFEIGVHYLIRKKPQFKRKMTYSEYYSSYPPGNTEIFALFSFYSSGFTNLSFFIFTYFHDPSLSNTDLYLSITISLFLFLYLFTLNSHLCLKHSKSLIFSSSLSSLLAYFLLFYSASLYLKASLILLPTHFKSLSIFKSFILGKSKSNSQALISFSSLLTCTSCFFYLSNSTFLLLPTSLILNLLPQVIFLLLPLSVHPSFLPKKFEFNEMGSRNFHAVLMRKSLQESLLNQL